MYVIYVKMTNFGWIPLEIRMLIMNNLYFTDYFNMKRKR